VNYVELHKRQHILLYIKEMYNIRIYTEKHRNSIIINCVSELKMYIRRNVISMISMFPNL